MTEDDHRRLAQVLQSVRFQVERGEMPPDEFDRLIDRMMWAIDASDGDVLNRLLFADRCKGKAPL